MTEKCSKLTKLEKFFNNSYAELYLRIDEVTDDDNKHNGCCIIGLHTLADEEPLILNKEETKLVLTLLKEHEQDIKEFFEKVDEINKQ